MPLLEELREGIFRGFEKTGTVKNKDGVYEFWWNLNNDSKGGSTPDPGDDWWNIEETPKP